MMAVKIDTYFLIKNLNMHDNELSKGKEASNNTYFSKIFNIYYIKKDFFLNLIF